MSTISIKVVADPHQPPVIYSGIPWFPGITALQAMIIGQSINPEFSFRAVYASPYGAFIDQIGSITDTSNDCWLFSIDNQESVFGVSESIIIESSAIENIEIEWTYGNPTSSASHQSQMARKKVVFGAV